MTFSQARAQMPGVTLEGAAAIVVIGRAVIRLIDAASCPRRGSRCCVTSTRSWAWISL